MRYEGRERRKTPLPMRTCVLSQIQADLTEISEVRQNMSEKSVEDYLTSGNLRLTSGKFCLSSGSEIRD